MKNEPIESNPSFLVKTSPLGQYGSNHVDRGENWVSGQTRHFRSKPSPLGQYGSNHVDRGKNWVSSCFRSKLSFSLKPSTPDLYKLNYVDRDKNWVLNYFRSKLLFSIKTPDSPCWYRSKFVLVFEIKFLIK